MRMSLRPHEMETIKQWFGVVRRAYNTAVSVHRSCEGEVGDSYSRVILGSIEVKCDELRRPLIKTKDGKIHDVTRGWSDANKQIT